MRLLRKLSWIFSVSFRLAADVSSSRRLLAGGLWLLIADGRKSRRRIGVRLRKFGTEFPFMIEDLGDYGTLVEIFIDEIYALDASLKPQTIFDLGSNIGASAIYFRICFPDARIYCFEPDPENFRRLSENTSTMDTIRVSPFAAWSQDGEITFYSDPHRGNSSSCARRRDRQFAVTVEGRTLDTLMRDAGVEEIDLLKFDVEGAEKEIFAAFQSADRVRHFIGEVHSDLVGGADRFVETLSSSHTVICRPLAPDRQSVAGSLLPAASTTG